MKRILLCHQIIKQRREQSINLAIFFIRDKVTFVKQKSSSKEHSMLICKSQCQQLINSFSIVKNMDWYDSDEGSFPDQQNSNSQHSVSSLSSGGNSQNEMAVQIKADKEHQHEPSNQKITPQQVLSLTEENISCQICCKYALNAVKCTNAKCQKLMCQSCVNNTKQNLEDRCPFCRETPFNIEPSTYTRVINKMELVCLLCKEKYILQQEEKHYKINCSIFHKTSCRYCNEKLEKNAVVAHTKEFHSKEIDEIIYNLYNNPPPQHDYKALLAKNKLYFQKIDKRPMLGTSGKFYCGGKLETKCSCCNGHCGPTNGENCVECMKLDIQKFGLPKGYLVNTAGMVCYLRGNDWVCGVKLFYEQGQCSEGNTCRQCANMKKNIKRYHHLI